MQILTNYTRLLFIFADMCEAEAVIQGYPFEKKHLNFYTYRDTNHLCFMDLLILKQWGRDGVISSLTPELLSNYHACVNMGFAGSSSFCFPLHNCYTITRVAELNHENPQDPSPQPELTLLPLPSLSSAHLASSSIPYKYGMLEHLQLIDMEGYTIAQLCKNHNLPCIMIKIVSDYTTPKGSDYLKKNKHALAETLCVTLRECLISIIALVTPSNVKKSLPILH